VAEDAYGTRKRLEFVSAVVAARRPASVLDIGCGTGEQLTFPLAQAHPGTRFLGVDPDERSIEHARRSFVRPNLAFSRETALPGAQRFDLIIASEVLEHVESPGDFLRGLVAGLEPRGAIVLTVPNGFGPFELGSLAESLLAQVLPIGRGARPGADTLAASPHVNFFSWRTLRGALGAAGLRVLAQRNRTVLCGFGFDYVVRGRRLIDWNARIADRLPAWCVSDWMMVLEPAATPEGGREYRRGGYARMRRWLNERRWGVHR
jgi:SAM-dependent methyltransferase